MSQQEFETYLSLLSRLLRLEPEQREQIAEELRDHLETRLEELKSQGVPHAEAVQQALDEFGDAAGVATNFFSLIRERRRKWAFRVTTVSLGAAAAAILLSVAFWPEAQRGPAPRRAVAQPPMTPAGTANPPVSKPAAPAPRKLTEVEEKLTKRINVEFMETPLSDVLSFLADTADVQFYVNNKALDELGLAMDAPVTLRLKDVRLETVLDLALEQLGGNAISYAERDGVLVISETSLLADRLEVHAYNCRDLLAMEMPGRLGANPAAAGGFGGGTTDAAAAPAGLPAYGNAAPGASLPMGGLGGGGMGSGFGVVSGFGSQHDARASHLMQLVTQIVKPDTWAEVGGPGSVAEYGGLLVVRQNPQVHREVEKLLAMLREQASQNAR